jgi:mannobiose 2-epimerase
MPRPLRDYLNFADRGARALGRIALDRLAPLPFSGHPPLDQTTGAVLDTQPLLERMLTQNLVDYWYPACIDDKGGYRFDRDDHGFVPAQEHRTIAVARTVWFFAALSRSPWGKPEHLDAARHGMQTMRETLWDAVNGGFFYETDRHGAPLIDTKSAYAHAFALSAATEMAEAGDDAACRAFATQVFSVYEDHLHDDTFGGYRELAGPAWEHLGGPVPSIRYAHPAHRTLNGLVHITEAMVAYARLCRTPIALARLAEVVRLLGDTTVHRRYGAGIDTYAPNWTPILDYQYPRIAVSYGHEAERVAVIGRAADVLGLPTSLVHDRMRWIVDNQLRWGWDRVRGGVFLSGALGGPAWDPAKLWWVQAESMTTYLDLFARTGSGQAAQAYLATLRWIDRHQVDWAGGEWFTRIEPFGRITSPKTDVWKTPFHVGRSLMLALARLDELGRKQDTVV